MTFRLLPAAVPALLALVLAVPASAGPLGSTELVDRPSGFGELPYGGLNDTIVRPHALSADGCFLVFASSSDDLLSTDVDSAENVYRQNRCAPGSKPVQVNTTQAGEPAQAFSSSSLPTISADGRYVAFGTGAANLHPAAGSRTNQVLVKDMNDGSLELASRGDGPNGAPAESAGGGVISGDGSAVAFRTSGVLDTSNINGVANETNLFVRYLGTNETWMASVNASQATETAGSARGGADITHDGKAVAFTSSDGLVAGDNDALEDAYLRRVIGTGTDETRIVSAGSSDPAANAASDVAINGNGTDSQVAYTNSQRAMLTLCPAFGCAVPAGLDAPVNGGSNTGGHFGPFFGQTLGGAATNVFWHSDSALDGADTNGVEDIYRHTLPPTPGTLSRVPTPAGPPIFGGDATDNGNLVVFSRDAFPAQSFELIGGQTRNLMELMGITPREKASAEGEIGQLHALSDDGRFVTFVSEATGLGAPRAAGSGRPVDQIFVRDMATGETRLVSAAPGGSPQDVASSSDRNEPSIDGAGTKVVFPSKAANLVAEATGGVEHVYLRDLATGSIRLLDRTAAGQPSAGGADGPQISRDGTKVIFLSRSPDLPDAPNTNESKLYMADVASGQVTRIDRKTGGELAPGSTTRADLDSDGSRVAFATDGNLGGPADGQHVYVRDLAADTTTWVSQVEPNGPDAQFAVSPSLSGDGNRVAFTMLSHNPGDIDAAFVHELTTQETFPASATAPATERVGQVTISADGQTVAFRQGPGVFARNLSETGQTRLDIRNGSSEPGSAGAFQVSLSGNGRCAAMNSHSNDLVSPGYGPDDSHVYLRAFGADCPAIAASRDTTAPVISRARVKPKRFAVAKRKTPRVARKRKPKRGTKFIFTLSEAASTKITIARKQRVKRKRTRFVKKLTLTRSKTKKGVNRVKFTGRVGKKRLRPGTYRATLVATDPSGNRSKPKRLRFKVVRKG
jgi:TolB protein